jgi:hypothetical protein
MPSHSHYGDTPYFLGDFVIYASSIYAAREVFNKIADDDDSIGASGSESSYTGEKVVWRWIRRSAVKGTIP